jgi:hypothetical protein
MSADLPKIPSEWGEFSLATTTMSDGEVMVFNWYVAGVEPELMLSTADAAEAAGLLPRLSAFFGDRSAWHRRATDAVVTRFSEAAPAPDELDDAEHDLLVATIEVRPGGELVLHLDDSCGEHFPEGYWPAVRFDEQGAVIDVTVEA